MRTYTTRRLGLGAGLVALSSCGVIAAAGPAAASGGEVAVAVATGAGLEVAVQQDGAPAADWTIEPVAGGDAWGSPSLFRQRSGGLLLTDSDSDGSLWFFWQGAGATNWNPEEVAGPGSVAGYTQPSIASQYTVESGEATDTVIVAEDGDGDYGSTAYWAVNGVPGWHSEKLPSPDGVATQPDVTVSADNTFLVSYDTDGSIYTPSSPGFGIDQEAFNSTTWSEVVWLEADVPFDLEDTSVIEQPGGALIVGAGDAKGNTYFFWSPAGKASTTWYQESVETNDFHFALNPSYVQPLTLTGDDQGVAVGGLSSSDKCDLSVDEPNGGTVWTPQSVGCPGGTGVEPPALDGLQSNGYGQTAATSDAAGNAFFYWQAYGSSTWNAEKIPGISSANTYTAVALASD
jgi:hypothetical protein